MALEDILKKIEEKNKKDIARVKKETKEKCEDINRETERLVSELEKENRLAASLKADKLKESMLQNARLHLAQEILNTKGSVIDSVFEEALTRLEDLPEKEYAGWMEKIISRVIEPGENEIVLSQKFAKKADASKFLENVNKKLAGKSFVKLSENAREITGGFILKRPKKEFNCLFKSLIEEKKNELKVKISKILFINVTP